MAKKIAEQLIDTLVESGVERIYAVTGDSLNEVNEAVRKNNKIQWIHVRHEETGAYAAAAEAQLTGRIGCCAGSSGPGHVHLINGLYDAQRSGAPVIAIASTIPSGEFGTEYFQETNTIKLFNDCSYYNEVATTPGQFPRMLQSAIQTAITRKGVAVVGLPGDLAKASSVSVDSSVKNYPAPPEVCPAEEDLIQLAELLNNHKRITLFCGIGCRGAHEEVIALSEKLNAPVVYTFKGKMEVQYENPYEVGMTGLLGMPSGYYSMHEAEVLLMLGTDFPYSAFLPDDIKIAQIDIKPERLGRRAKVDIGLCGDVRMTIQALLRMLDPKTDDTFLLKQLKRYEGVKKDLAAYTENKGDIKKIHPEYVMSEIDKLASDDAIFTVDTGMTCVWGARYLQATGKHVLADLSMVKNISEITISEIYPHYYPKGAVGFFLEHHSEENILGDIKKNRVFLCLDTLQNAIGTITVKDNEICRLFVLPAYQGKGFGTEMLDFAERIIFEQHSKVVLDVSLPAKQIYLKRGYKEIKFNIITTRDNDYLCYDVMEKKV